MRPPPLSATASRPAGPETPDRARLRLRSLSWALLAAAAAGGLALIAAAAQAADPATGLESVLRAAGCGFFYGLLAFHLQRVDPDDSHLQAGLVGAVCGIRSLAAPLAWPASPGLPEAPLAWLEAALPTLLAQWLPLWLPLVAAAVSLALIQRQWPSLRP